MTICNDETMVLRTNNRTMIDATLGPAKVIAHEYGHQWLAQPDEYWDVGGCGGSIGLCGHTIMELPFDNRHSLCINADHRMHVEDRRTTWNRIRGPIGYACNGGAGWVDAASGWARMSGIVPGGVIPSFSPQNLIYVNHGFANSWATSSIGNGWFF
jgi:hypothetical protein